jgi:hypothetical protein
MKYFEVDFSLITGAMIGFEWVPKGVVEDDFGHFVFDLVILRIFITYN